MFALAAAKANKWLLGIESLVLLSRRKSKQMVAWYRLTQEGDVLHPTFLLLKGKTNIKRFIQYEHTPMDASLNFVALVESNPLTRLSQDYNNRFITKIQEMFTEQQQQMFVASMYCFLNHHSTNDYIIDLDNVWPWLGFSQKDAAKRVLEKHFTVDKDYKCLPHKLAEQKKERRGGHNKETILLNVQTFKLLCIKADTKKSHEIHEYFIKLEELLQTIVLEESNELKLQLEKVNLHLLETEQNTQRKIALEKQNMLIREYISNINLVYVIRVKQFDNGAYIVKIGESRRGVEGRFSEHRTKYGGDILLLDCFAVKKSKDFERFLHTHELIRPHRVQDLPGHESDFELFRIGQGLSYQQLLTTIHQNIQRFNDVDEKYIEEMLVNVVATMNRDALPSAQTALLNDILQHQQEMSQRIQRLETTNQQILEKLHASQQRTTTQFHTPLPTLGPRLQQINPETMTLHKVYESVSECITLHRHKLKRPSIDKAVKENTVYQGYRWLYVERDQDPHIITNLVQTKPTRPQNMGYIAQLDSQKLQILRVYLDRKSAAVANGYSISGLDAHVLKGSPSKGYYYVLYDRCSDQHKEEFEDRLGGQPILYKDGIGQYNTDNQLVQEFVCKYDCIKRLKMSDKTLAKALDKNVLYQNHYFRSMGSKTVCEPI